MGRSLPPGVHVNAVGSYRPETRELDTRTVRRGGWSSRRGRSRSPRRAIWLIPIGEGAIEAADIVRRSRRDWLAA